MNIQQIMVNFAGHLAKAKKLGYQPLMPTNEEHDVNSFREIANLMRMEYFSIGLWLKYNRLAYIAFDFEPTTENYDKALQEIMEELDRL